MASRDVHLPEALSRGVALTRASPQVVGLALGAEVGGDLLSLAASVALAASLFSSFERALGSSGPLSSALVRGTPLLAVAGAVVVAGLLALALRLLFASVGARLFCARLAGESLSFGQAFAQARWDRVVPVAALYAVLSLAVTLFDSALIASGALILVNAPSKGFAAPGVAALSAGLVATLALGLLLTLLIRLWLIRAVAADQNATTSLSGALALIGRRIGTLSLLVLLFGVLEGIAAAVASTGGLLALGGGTASIAVGLTARAATGLLVSGFKALFVTAELGALAAIDAGERGTLPEPPISVAEPILATQPILGTEEIRSAEPVS